MSFSALVYHEIRDDLNLVQQPMTPLKAANAYAINLPTALFLNSEDFKHQMDYLVEQQFHFLSMQEVKDYYEKNIDLPHNSVLITFDDAFQSLYTTAYPILKELGIKATLFLVSGWLFDDASDYNASASQVLSMVELQAMSDVFELANHTHDLHNLIKVGVNGAMEASFEALQADLSRCNQVVKHKDTFAYPFGFYHETLIDNLAKLGFKYAFTTKVGRNDRSTDCLKLNRALIFNKMPFENFQQIVNT